MFINSWMRQSVVEVLSVSKPYQYMIVWLQDSLVGALRGPMNPDSFKCLEFDAAEIMVYNRILMLEIQKDSGRADSGEAPAYNAAGFEVQIQPGKRSVQRFWSSTWSMYKVDILL